MTVGMGDGVSVSIGACEADKVGGKEGDNGVQAAKAIRTSEVVL